MVVIRLARIGSKNNPRYRVTVADSRKPLGGRFIEVVGYYDPLSKKASIDKNKYEAWVQKGAKPSQRVKSVFSKIN